MSDCSVSVVDHNNGLTVFRLHPGDEVKVRMTDDGRVQVARRCANADEVIRRLEKAGAEWAEYQASPEYQENRSVWCLDPEQNGIEPAT